MPPRRTRPSATSYDPSTDPELAHLSPTQIHRLESAFTHAGESKADKKRRNGLEKPSKRRKLDHDQPGEDADEGAGGGGFVPDDAEMEGGGGLMLPDDEAEAGGGFMVDDEDDAGGGGGGFLPEDSAAHEPQPAQDFDMSPPLLASPPPSTSTRTHLTLSLVPAALRLAGLPPADASILDFFKQSAEGWDDAPPPEEEGGVREKGVARRDWFAVCGILISSREDEVEGEEEEEEEEEPEELVEDEDSEDAADVFQPEEEESDAGVRRSPMKKGKGKGKGRVGLDEDEGDEIEFDPSNTSRRRTRRTAKEVSPVASLPSDADLSDGSASSTTSKPKKGISKGAAAAKAKPKPKPKKTAGAADHDDGGFEEQLDLTRAEKKHARETFELLLGPAGVRKGKQVLEVREVGGAAKMLGEGWTIEEIKEMVTMFSTAPDKASLTLGDFERMMWEGGLFP